MADLIPERAVLMEQRDGVVILSIDNPPVNALSSAVTTGLALRLAAAESDRGVQAVVVTGAGGNFVAGADITRLEKLAGGVAPQPGGEEPALGELLGRIEDAEKPVVAAIDGFALGGGLELALACAARVGSERCRVGLPELTLGLIPGAGGTQRLPRLVGVAKAAEIMLTSRQVRAPEALSLGIIDELRPVDQLVDRAVAVALEIAGGRRERRRTLRLTERIEPADEARRLIEALRAEHARKSRNVQHPGACLDAILDGAVLGPAEGLRRERERFEALLAGSGARGLIHFFFAQRAAAKVPGVTDAGLQPRPIRRAGVIGGGTMGSGIATALVTRGVEVVLRELDAALCEKARARVAKNVGRDVEKGRSSAEQAQQTLARLRAQTGLDGFEELDLVIEAATEKVELKQSLFAELAVRTHAPCILATNTSTIDIDVVSARCESARPRVLGTHFFSPAHVMQLVEVIRTRTTSAQALCDTLGLVRQMGKTAVVVGNCPGFLVNRVFMPYGQMTGFLIDRGIDPYRIDRALYDFGMPMGPCRMGDLAGLDVSVYAGSIMDAAYPDRAYRSALRRILVEAGRLGEKSGAGHYRHENGKALEDPALGGYVEQARAAAGNPPRLELTDDEIVRAVLFGVVNEACRALDEGVALRAGDVDVAINLGMGFPAYRGGPMKWADGFGARAVHDALAGWHERWQAPPLSPSEWLRRKAERGESLLA
jgi:enoyl-CoA hydratase/3-hydroxyacyl-CoA dehydrogenase